jgi:Uncharacterized protein conserved in bacteria
MPGKEKYYVALLRGINVGGKNLIKMDDLKRCFSEAGFTDVRTYIQSGNVFFRTGIPREKLPAILSAMLKDRFGYELPVMVKSREQIERVVSQKPERFGEENDDFWYDVFFFSDSVSAKDVYEQHIRIREGVDFVSCGDHALYISRLRKGLTKSYINKISSTPVFNDITARNWNTTSKLLELMNDCSRDA